MAAKQSDLRALKTKLQDLIDQGVSEIRLSPRSAPRRTPPPTSEALLPHPDAAIRLQEIRDEMGNCTRCKLCQGRTHIVFGVGNPRATLMFVGEGPGRDEDLQGEPFVGRAGQLLTKMIEAMGMMRPDVYIGNIIKCRPPDNRYPEPDEVETCFPFLVKQIEAIRPKVIVTLGNLATQTLLQTRAGITTLHGSFKEFRGIPVMPTYHPAFLLRNPNMKKPCWEDLKKVISLLKTVS